MAQIVTMIAPPGSAAGALAAMAVMCSASCACVGPAPSNEAKRAAMAGVDGDVDAHAGAQLRQVLRSVSKAIRTGTRCTTLTQLPVAFCGGRIANCAPVPGLTASDRAV